MDQQEEPGRLPHRIPVILAADSPVSSSEELQQLAEMSSLPETLEGDRLEGFGHGRKVVGTTKFYPISFDEMQRIHEKAEVLLGAEHAIWVIFKGELRFARVVKSLKEGVTLGGEDGKPKGNEG
jgi:hypothetical protein